MLILCCRGTQVLRVGRKSRTCTSSHMIVEPNMPPVPSRVFFASALKYVLVVAVCLTSAILPQAAQPFHKNNRSARRSASTRAPTGRL